MPGDALAELLSPAYRDKLTDLEIAEVRGRRSACQAAEGSLSFLRRLVQGRHDIVRAELDRRASGGSPKDLAELVASLPDILSNESRPAPSGRFADVDVAMADMESGVAAPLFSELEQMAGGAQLGSLPDMSESEVHRIADDLADFEAIVSARRRQLHRQIDAFNDELVRRYRSGEASVDSLLET